MSLDLALASDALLAWARRGRPGADPAWVRLEELRSRGEARLWAAVTSLSAACAAAAGSAVAPEDAAAADALRAALGTHLRPFTVDAASALEAAARPARAFDAAAAASAFLRLCPGGILVTDDPEALAALPGARSLADALASASPAAPAAPVPMLDLREEYRLGQPGLDRALLDAASAAQYILGPQVGRFETSLAGYLGAARAVGVSSGTEALVLALRALCLTRFGRERFREDEYVLTSPFTFVATGDAILRSGARPLFADVDAATLNLDPESARRALASAPGKVVGLIPVHLFGAPCDMDALLALAREHGLFVLEDVAQAFGAAWKGRRLGTLGDAAAFSFFPSKNLGGFGDAGAVAASDAGLAESVSLLLKHGGQGKGTFDVLGYNARLDTLQAAVLLEKLPELDARNRARREVARAYVDGLAGAGDLVLPPRPEGDPLSHVFHQFTLRTARRDALREHLAKDGVASMLYYPHPLHRMRLFAGRCATAGDSGLPVAEKAAAEVLSLPIGPTQPEAATARVVASVRRFFGA